MKQILLKTPRGNTAVIPVDHFVAKARAAALSGNAVLCCSSAEETTTSFGNQSYDACDWEAEREASAIAAAIDTTRIFDEDDVDRRGKEELLCELIGASKRRDVGRKRNVRCLYNLEVEGDEDGCNSNSNNNCANNDRMDVDIDDESCPSRQPLCSSSSDESISSGEEQQRVVTHRFDDMDINDEQQYYSNLPKSRRRNYGNCGVRSSATTTTCQSPRKSRMPFVSQPSEERNPSRQTWSKAAPTPASNSSSSTPPLMVAFYHQGRKVSLDRIWDWITGSPESSTEAASASAAVKNSSSSSSSSFVPQFPLYLTLSTSVRLLGGIDRQNRVGSKFGGGGVSSSQNAERERKERLKKLALESIDLAKDPYLMRNHLGTYECKLCLTLHTNEANYLAHTQGKKHQAGLAKRAHMEKLKREREEMLDARSGGLKRPPPGGRYGQQQQPSRKTIKIGRPAYQVFKSRDTDTNQRCLTFELTYKDIREDLRPRHRFMSAFEQRVDLPRDKRYQYVLFAAEPYDTIAFKIPNEPLDRDQGRLITHWDEDDKKFTMTLYFADHTASAAAPEGMMEAEGNVSCTFAPPLISR